MIDDERPDAPEEQPAEPETPGGEEEALEPSSSADPSESPAAGEEPAAEEPAAEEPAAEPPAEEPSADAPEEPTPEPTAEEPAPEAPADEPAPEEVAAPDASSQPAEAAEERPKRDKKKKDDKAKEPDVVPGAHLEPDLVLEPERTEDDELARYAADDAEPGAEGAPEDGESADSAAAPAARSVIDFAADARYRATGKRKTAVARVIISPGDGGYTINGRSLEDFFPRAALQKAARKPLEVAGFESRMNVVARIHGGGVSAQAGALRHGVARALVEADPALRPELKRRGLLTRDARAKERKKAGLKKARKRPQFSKR